MPKPKEAPIPAERYNTIRQDIIRNLTGNILSAREISGAVGIPEKDVYQHLEHIRKSLKKRLTVIPAQCANCGFIFRKRERLSKPGRCPVCREGKIEEPLFSIKENSAG